MGPLSSAGPGSMCRKTRHWEILSGSAPAGPQVGRRARTRLQGPWGPVWGVPAKRLARLRELGTPRALRNCRTAADKGRAKRPLLCPRTCRDSLQPAPHPPPGRPPHRRHPDRTRRPDPRGRGPEGRFGARRDLPGLDGADLAGPGHDPVRAGLFRPGRADPGAGLADQALPGRQSARPRQPALHEGGRRAAPGRQAPAGGRALLRPHLRAGHGRARHQPGHRAGRRGRRRRRARTGQWIQRALRRPAAAQASSQVDERLAAQLAAIPEPAAPAPQPAAQPAPRTTPSIEGPPAPRSADADEPSYTGLGPGILG